MRVPRVYTPQPLTAHATLQLEADAAHHLARVLRVKTGRPVQLFNGDGTQFDAIVCAVDRAKVTVEVQAISMPAPESPLRIELGIAVPANDRMDWLLQKATELGVGTVTPLVTEFSQNVAKRADKRLGHWRRVAINACEQCGRAVLPVIESLSKVEDWIAADFDGAGYVLAPAAGGGRPAFSRATNIRLLVGPEGGLSEREIDAAVSAGFTPWQLGPRVLRSETAPLAAIAVLQAMAGDF